MAEDDVNDTATGDAPAAETMLTPRADGTLRIKFECDGHEMDSATFIGAFVGFTRVLWAINDELETGHKINVRVKAPEKGSLELEIEVILTLLEKIGNLLQFGGPNTVIAGEIIGTLLVVLGAYKTIAKKKEKANEASPAAGTVQQGSNAQLTNSGNGNVFNYDQRTINNMIMAPEIKGGCRQIAEAISNDPEVKGVELQDGSKGSLFRASHEEWTEILEALPGLERVSSSRIISVREKIPIIRPSFDPKYVWDCSRMGVRIHVHIKDEDFLARVARREEVFESGDVLEVEMDISQELQPGTEIYVCKQYVVTRVLHHEKAFKDVRVVDHPDEPPRFKQ